MSTSQKSHSQKRTAQHVSVAGNIHSQKGISMPAVPALQMKDKETESQPVIDKSYSTLSGGDASDRPGTKPLSAFVAPVQKKSTASTPMQRFEAKIRPADRDSAEIAQFKSYGSQPVQLEGKMCQTAGEVQMLGVPGGPPLKTLPAGTLLKSMSVDADGWAHVNIAGEVGYVKNDTITPI